MPILTGDVKLLAAERLLDTPDGGGRMTGHVVADGRSNNLFADISELDRAYGRVSLRKVYVGVLTDSTDSYYGAHVIVAEPPLDPRVSVTLFTTHSWTDRRSAARDRIERYLARGVKWPGQLLERQLAGQRAVSLLLKPADALPRVGQALALVQDESQPEEVEQYVRLTRISSVERDFTVSDGNQAVHFTGVVVTCEISDPLRMDFEGPAPMVRDDLPKRAVARDTLVANAAVYYGIAPTVAEGGIGDLRVQVASLFGQLVPSAQSETPLVDLNAAGQAAPVIESGTKLETFTAAGQVGAGKILYLGNACTPKSLRLTGGGYEFVDDAGGLKSGSSVIGTVDYARGVIAFGTGAPEYAGAIEIAFRPAAAPVRVADTAAIVVAPENRGYAYTITLAPPPKPGALVVSYLAQGKWYDLRDRGAGVLRGTDTSFGAGSVDYETGSVILTTGALPDANSTVLFAWGTAASYFKRAKEPVPPLTLRHTVEHPGIAPGTLRLRWTDGRRNRTASDDGHGVISGDAKGSVRYALGQLMFRPDELPAGGAEIAIDYEWGPPQEVRFEHPLRNDDGTLTLQLPHTDIRRDSVELEFNLLIQTYEPISTTPAELQITQPVDPIKVVRDAPKSASSVTAPFDGDIAGSIHYASGVLTFKPDTTTSVPRARYKVQELGNVQVNGHWERLYRNTFDHWDYVPTGASMPVDDSGYVRVRYRAVDTPNQASESITVGQLALDLSDRYAERIVPGSVRFTLGGKTYVDRLGTLVADVNVNTGAGLQAGTLDYASGRAVLSLWQPGAPNTVAMQSLLTELGGQPVDEVVFRVPAAPVRPASVQIRAASLSGGQIAATVTSEGVIVGDGMLGSVDYQTGVVRVRFGRRVQAAGHEAEPWYRPEAIVDEQIVQPLPVYADTIRFNAVAFSYLPLSADVLGLDPVRLPVDGRVPVFRPGDVVVVHHTARTAFPVNAGAGSSLDVGRVRLTSLRMLDADGKALPPDRYRADLDAGTVQLLDPAGFAAPLSAEHRVEDMALISDTQINGVLTLTRPLTHEYPIGSYVSSALILGDLQARAHTLFAQQTWTGEWSDARIGAGTTAQYNEAVYPLAVTNRGAIEERWALIFTNTNEFRVIGESVGQIAIGNNAADLAPLNPEMHVPYFQLQAAGWGAGWSAGNVLRFDTAGANAPVWVARTVLQGHVPSGSGEDGFAIQVRGDVDR